MLGHGLTSGAWAEKRTNISLCENRSRANFFWVLFVRSFGALKFKQHKLFKRFVNGWWAREWRHVHPGRDECYFAVIMLFVKRKIRFVKMFFLHIYSSFVWRSSCPARRVFHFVLFIRWRVFLWPESSDAHQRCMHSRDRVHCVCENLFRARSRAVFSVLFCEIVIVTIFHFRALDRQFECDFSELWSNRSAISSTLGWCINAPFAMRQRQKKKKNKSLSLYAGLLLLSFFLLVLEFSRTGIIDGCGMMILFHRIERFRRFTSMAAGANETFFFWNNSSPSFRFSTFSSSITSRDGAGTLAHVYRLFGIPSRWAHNAHKQENVRRERAQVIPTHLKNGIRFCCCCGNLFRCLLTSEWKRQQCQPREPNMYCVINWNILFRFFPTLFYFMAFGLCFRASVLSSVVSNEVEFMAKRQKHTSASLALVCWTCRRMKDNHLRFSLHTVSPHSMQVTTTSEWKERKKPSPGTIARDLRNAKCQNLWKMANWTANF